MQELHKHCYILTGAMGGGKSTLLKELAAQEFITIDEPARQLLAEQRSIGGRGIPDKDPRLFCELLLSRSLYEFKHQSDTQGTVIFDRGIADCIAYAEYFKLDIQHYLQAAKLYRYNTTVFFTPGWEAIYHTDDERKMSYQEAHDFGEKLKEIYLALGYRIIVLPHDSPLARAEVISNTIHQLRK